MKKISLVLLLLLSLLSACAVPSVTPAPTLVVTNTIAPSPTSSVTPASTATATSTATSAPTSTPTVEPSPTATRTPKPTIDQTSIAPTTQSGAATTEATTEATVAPQSTNPPPSSIKVTLAPPPDGGSCGKYPCNDDIAGWEARLHLPPGFKAKHIATISGHPTSITYDPNGQLVASTMEGSIYRFDAAGGATIIASGFHLPIGLAYRPGTFDLYIASRSFAANAVPNEGKVTIVHADGSKEDIVTGLPCCYTSNEHQPDSIAFGSDGKVYLSIGARGDHGEVPGQPEVHATLTPLEAGILRFNPDGSGVERYATGLRNPYDLTFDANGNLYATDNSPDFGPPDRLQRVTQGGYYGYPYYAGCGVCASAPDDLSITPPFATFIPHGAVTGITAYLGHQFPADYFNNLFVTLWSAFPGAQKIVRIQLSPFKMSDFALGLASPVDVTVAPDGALVVADWATGLVFKISYAP